MTIAAAACQSCGGGARRGGIPTTTQAPLLRLVGSTGPEVINYRPVGTVYILDGLFNVAELRVGTGPHAELVRLYRGQTQAMRCSGDASCPVWSERIAGR
jgi:hypothetical protein